MKKILLILFMFATSFYFTSAQTGWVQLNSGTTSNLNCVYFINSNTGFVGADNGILLKTMNGGINWSRVDTSLSYRRKGLFFISEQTGFCIGYSGPGAHYYPKSRRTYDAGQSWDFTGWVGSTGDWYPLTCLHFPNNQTGYIAAPFPGLGFALSKTTDSGNSFVLQYFNYDAGNSIFFTSAITGYTVGARIVGTTNGGTSWNILDSSLNHGILYSIFFPNSTTGFTTGESGAIFRTTDGVNWIPLTSNTSLSLNSVYFTSYNTGYVSGQSGIILKTTNSGTNWINQNTGSLADFNAIFFPSADTGYAIGSNGTILKTTTGGITFVNPISTEISNQFSLSQNYPNPFNQTTKIRFALPKNSFAKIVVYDALGREVETLVNDQLNAGTYEAEWNASNFASGVYYYKLVVGDNTNNGGFVDTKKMVLVK